MQLPALLLLTLQAPSGVQADLGPRPAEVLVPAGATWRYLDDGRDAGTAWRAPAFDDSAWAAGRAQLGYGDGDETTVVSFGSNPNQKHVTTYFRRSFSVADPTAYLGLRLRLLRDDGALVYLNGVEVERQNMPAGSVHFRTFASGTVSGAAEDTFFDAFLPVGLLRAGRNVLAVEVHQRRRTSSDISFDLGLEGLVEPSIVRGPYLQLGTHHGVVVRWSTDVPTDGRVWFGTDPQALDRMESSTSVAVHHEIWLDGLAPATQYSYVVGTSAGALATHADQRFETAPLPGARVPTIVWVLGDSGTADASARAVRDAYYQASAGTRTNLWLMLGDNAYPSGSEEQFQTAVFDTYPEMLRQSVLWSTRGNHETLPSVYYDLVTLPTRGEAGGVPSGTEAYYSFDWANVHFICLDSQGSDRSIGGAMHTWLTADLAATTQDWVVAFWHHPPYTKGSHDSDFEQQLIDMRTNFLPTLEAGGVDLVLSGHSHSYERSFLIDGHYGPSSTFGPQHLKDGGDGQPSGNGAYVKVDQPNAGTVYTVAGSAGRTSPGPLNHPAMFHSVSELGSLVLDFEGHRVNGYFLRDDGSIDDAFTMLQVQPLGLGADTTVVSAANPHPIGLRLDPGPGYEHAPYVVVVRAPRELAPAVPGPLWVGAAGELDAAGGGAASLVLPAELLRPLAGLRLSAELWVQDPGGSGDVIWRSGVLPLAVRP